MLRGKSGAQVGTRAHGHESGNMVGRRSRHPALHPHKRLLPSDDL